MELKDKRIKVLNEIFSGIKVWFTELAAYCFHYDLYCCQGD